MNLEQEMAAIGAELQAFHDKTGASVDLKIYLSDGASIYTVWIAAHENIRHEFASAQILIDWMRDVNADIDPNGSAMARKRLETLLADKIKRDAEVAALVTEIGELPDTQVIKDAQAIAEKTIQESESALRVLTEAKALLEAQANQKQTETVDALATASDEELAKMQEIIATEKDVAP